MKHALIEYVIEHALIEHVFIKHAVMNHAVRNHVVTKHARTGVAFAPRLRACRWLCLLLPLPLAALAATRDDYAQQWPLQLNSPDAGAYRVVLDEAVYRQAQSHALRDLQVIDADGNPVATALFGPEAPLAPPPQAIEVPWFPLQVGEGGDSPALRDMSLVVRRDAQGDVVSISSQVALAQADAASNGAAPNPTWLIDLGRERKAAAALLVEWSPYDGALDLAYRLEGSDDLRAWRTLDSEVRLVDLRNRGFRMQRNRVELPTDGMQPRYLRLVPLQRKGAPAIAQLRVELRTQSRAADWRWVTLRAQPSKAGDPDKLGYRYVLNGRFPVERADVELAGNAAVAWRSLESLEPVSEAGRAASSAEPHWAIRVGPWTSYRMSGDGRTTASAAQAISGGGIRDRDWRLQPDRALQGDAPRLKLGYRPETLVFLAQGRPPYALVAGSRRAQRQDAPLNELVDALRQQRGPQWQPDTATLGPMQALAGDAALVPAPVQRDWKSWLLWAVLIVGALVVVGFAASLLKKPQA